MKYWKRPISENLTYDEAKMLLNQGYFITRPEQDGFHFLAQDNKTHCILLKTGEVVVNPKEIYDTDKNDWMTAVIENEAMYAVYSQEGVK